MENQRVNVYTRYDHYKYYKNNKHIFRLKYLDKKEREKNEVPKEYYENYYRNWCVVKKI